MREYIGLDLGERINIRSEEKVRVDNFTIELKSGGKLRSVSATVQRVPNSDAHSVTLPYNETLFSRQKDRLGCGASQVTYSFIHVGDFTVNASSHGRSHWMSVNIESIS